MRPLIFPCGCEFTFIDDFIDAKCDGEFWDAELCEFHKQIMSEYLKDAQI